MNLLEFNIVIIQATKAALGVNAVKDYLFKTAKGKVIKQTNGLYPAPLKILEVLRYVLQIRLRTHGFGSFKLLKRFPCLLYSFDNILHLLQVSIFRTGLDKGEAESYKAEHTKFGELCVTTEAKGLMSLFHGQVNCGSICN